MRLATASGRRSQQPPDQTSAYRCGRSRLRRLGQPYQPSPRPSPLCAHPRRSRCLMLRSKSDVRSERGSGCSSRFQTPSGRRIVALSGASVGLVEGVLGAANVRIGSGCPRRLRALRSADTDFDGGLHDLRMVPPHAVATSREDAAGLA